MTNAVDNTVSVISDTTNADVATVGVGNQPQVLAYDSGKGEVFVGNMGDNTVSIIFGTASSSSTTSSASSSSTTSIQITTSSTPTTIATTSSGSSPTTTTSRSAGSSSSISWSYIAIVAINAALLLVLGGLVVPRRNTARDIS